jgi:hypothetical protein
MAEWIYAPQWGFSQDGNRVWVERWLRGDIFKSVYVTDDDSVANEEHNA